jgi:hypothetical protein
MRKSTSLRPLAPRHIELVSKDQVFSFASKRMSKDRLWNGGPHHIYCGMKFLPPKRLT